ncbi:MAG: hypothetical protein F6K40_07565 [Okeania sp. SIO3I5]|nr:hypothetical protein [Okeania sp. SIO3I5]NEQ36150.1 hypothetical protein [Okeania sp. SIO3I5]
MTKNNFCRGEQANRPYRLLTSYLWSDRTHTNAFFQSKLNLLKTLLIS